MDLADDVLQAAQHCVACTDDGRGRGSAQMMISKYKGFLTTLAKQYLNMVIMNPLVRLLCEIYKSMA